MGIKELRREIELLPNLAETVTDFQSNWVRPLRSNNEHLPFLKKLSTETKDYLNHKLLSLQPSIELLRNGQQIHERFHNHAHNLVELKLTSLNGNQPKQKLLLHKLGNDDLSSIKSTIRHVKHFQERSQLLSQHYQEINQLLEKQLSLEEMIFYMSLPHRKYLNTLLKTAEQHQKIVRDLGRHFVTIAEELQVHKNMRH